MSGADLTVALAGWRRISLEELNERAALLDRDETKYVLTESELFEGLSELDARFDVLSIGGVDRFSYDTVYFDTPDLLTYRQHVQDRRRRLKIRSRRYLDSPGLCWFEVKLKGRRGRTVKERMAYRDDDHGTVTPAAARFVDECAQATYGEPFEQPIEPRLGMEYRRITLVGRDRPERLTIDHSLRFRSGGTVARSPERTVIVEVKSPDGRGLADGVLRSLGRRPEPCSKYCVGLHLVGAELAHNRFSRTLRRHFDWHGPTAVAPNIRLEVELTRQELVAAERLVPQLRRRFPERSEVELHATAVAAVRSFHGAQVRQHLDVLAFRRAVAALAAR